MRFRADRQGDIAILRLIENLDFNVSRGLRSVLEAEMKESGGIVLDMTAIGYVASVTVGVLVDVHNRMKQEGKRGLVLLHPQDRVKEIFRLLHIGRLIPIVDDEKEAMTKIAAEG